MSLALATRLFLIRHGETLWNLEGRIQGHEDSPLSPLGHRQAVALAAALGVRRFDVLYSSDLGRALETARLVGAACRLTVQTDSRLRERHYGIAQGLTSEELAARYPDAYGSWRRGDPAWRMPGGESVVERHHRAVDVLDDLAARNEGGEVLIVTHGGILDSALRHALGIPLDAPRRFSIRNASVNELEVVDGSWTVRSWGGLAHLERLGSGDDE